MRAKDLARRFVGVVLSVALALPGNLTAQTSKNYTSFESCFRDQRVIAIGVGAAVGAVVSNKLADMLGIKGKAKTATQIGGGVLGGVIGNRVAWNNCLDAFPVKAHTEVVNNRASAVAQQSGAGATQEPVKALAIQNVSVGTLVFGRDLNVSVTYRYISDSADARDVKARVFRNLVFTGPDGAQQEVASSSEDTVQQGISRATFGIPTPSIQDAPELTSTRDWSFRFVVDIDGMHQEQVVALNVPQLKGGPR
jgi:uncharacterized protein YcfJ